MNEQQIFTIETVVTVGYLERIRILFGRRVNVRTDLTSSGQIIRSESWVDPLFREAPERVRPWELLVDEIDGHDRKPRCVYRVRYVDREVAATRWPDAAALIAQAPAPTDAMNEQQIFTIETVVTVGYLERIRILFGRRVNVRTDLTSSGQIIRSESWVDPLFREAPGVLMEGGAK